MSEILTNIFGTRTDVVGYIILSIMRVVFIEVVVLWGLWEALYDDKMAKDR